MKVLDRAWVNCLRVWKWVSENLPEGFSEMSKDKKEEIVSHLKRQWLEENQFTVYLNQDCFFCQYDKKHENNCTACPAVLVEQDFHCDADLYSYRHDPRAFYREILVLDAKRRS